MESNKEDILTVPENINVGILFASFCHVTQITYYRLGEVVTKNNNTGLFRGPVIGMIDTDVKSKLKQL